MYDTFTGLDAVAEFIPQDGHRYLEISLHDPKEGPPNSTTGVLKHDEIIDWVQQEVGVVSCDASPATNLVVGSTRSRHWRRQHFTVQAASISL